MVTTDSPRHSPYDITAPRQGRLLVDEHGLPCIVDPSNGDSPIPVPSEGLAGYGSSRRADLGYLGFAGAERWTLRGGPRS